MDAAGAVAVTVVAVALVVAAAVAGGRRGGVHLSLRIWWDGRRRDPDDPDDGEQ